MDVDVAPALAYLQKVKSALPRKLQTLKTGLLHHLQATHDGGQIDKLLKQLQAEKVVQQNGNGSLVYKLR